MASDAVMAPAKETERLLFIEQNYKQIIHLCAQKTIENPNKLTTDTINDVIESIGNKKRIQCITSSSPSPLSSPLPSPTSLMSSSMPSPLSAQRHLNKSSLR